MNNSFGWPLKNVYTTLLARNNYKPPGGWGSRFKTPSTVIIITITMAFEMFNFYFLQVKRKQRQHSGYVKLLIPQNDLNMDDNDSNAGLFAET